MMASGRGSIWPCSPSSETIRNSTVCATIEFRKYVALSMSFFLYSFKRTLVCLFFLSPHTHIRDSPRDRRCFLQTNGINCAPERNKYERDVNPWLRQIDANCFCLVLQSCLSMNKCTKKQMFNIGYDKFDFSSTNNACCRLLEMKKKNTFMKYNGVW